MHENLYNRLLPSLPHIQPPSAARSCYMCKSQLRHHHHVVYLCKYLFVGAVALDELVLADATAQADYVGNLGNYCVGEIHRFSIASTVSHIYTLHSYI